MESGWDESWDERSPGMGGFGDGWSREWGEYTKLICKK